MTEGMQVESVEGPAGGGLRVGIWIDTHSLSGGGGAERRFVRMVRHLSSQEGAPAVWLMLSDRMRRSLEEASLAVPPDRMIRVEEDPVESRGGLIRTAWRRSGRLRDLCRAQGLDVVHFLSASYHFIPFLAWRPKRTAVAFSVVAHPYVTRYEGLSWKARLALRVYLARADAIDSLYAGFPERFPRAARKTRVTPCVFTDYARYAPAARRENRIVFSGRLEPGKNPALFLEAVARIAGEMRAGGWRARMLGAGPEEGGLRDWAARNGIGDLVEIGPLADTSGVMTTSAIFVSLQDLENYPSQSLLEAMACGLAVIATDVGETRRLVGPGRGRLLERRDADELGGALVRLMRDPAEREELGGNARAFVVEHHTIGKATDHMRGIWELASSRRKRGAR